MSVTADGMLAVYVIIVLQLIISLYPLAIEAQLSDQSHFTAWLHPESQLCELE